MKKWNFYVIGILFLTKIVDIVLYKEITAWNISLAIAMLVVIVSWLIQHAHQNKT